MNQLLFGMVNNCQAGSGLTPVLINTSTLVMNK
ncbi:MAG: hypothetical protein UX84_C0026G0004 [Microgenomates group bacterium GW2011_GWD1_47_13]|nr:MAG: hypothetical protein US97_C0024G0003 [Microgenomates group bacterium GW2011_GWF1_38_5]KKU27377.1 MAG: hypothetical protein UX40_C0019G0007 [Microgenomates group bacterium GW2011_GWF2_46_18]KKU42252.1 MAG: hypothetical protein UX59_C0045G0004 [Microgenomates group bacterium GW2011_GWA1_46_7]KKU60462.1 MAG: hypothetical protein UX84_C0026G0004 [Microgenomates group bacterium GW2011_GWD1_47_13]